MNELPTTVLQQIDRLELEARKVVEGYLSGRHRSPRHGFAVEFAQHREYAPGDDIKHLDWKVYGRTERYHLKQYEQETNLVAWFVLDQSGSMRYGSNTRTKAIVAAEVTAALAYLILQQTDAAGLVPMAPGTPTMLRPAARMGSHFREFLRLLVTEPSDDSIDFGQALQPLAGRLGRRGIVFLVSDFLDEPT
ncbi:MAG: DUF58 domain-containing protein, partial [Gemmataceae bacterium]